MEDLPKCFFSGLKRRWTSDEDRTLKQAFKVFLEEKRMPPGSVLNRVRNSQLTGRTVPQIRTKIHNIINSKQNFKL